VTSSCSSNLVMSVSCTDHMGSGYIRQTSHICNVSLDRVNGLPVSDIDKVADLVLERGLCQLDDASQRYTETLASQRLTLVLVAE
jgi:hypothetical protein